METNTGAKVKHLREQVRASQEELAHFIGISRVSLANKELWKSVFKQRELEKIAEFFEKDIADFSREETTSTRDSNRKLKDLILYIASQNTSEKGIGKTVLNKLLYFSDFNYYEWTGMSISWTQYQKLPYGPVPVNIEDVLREMQQDGEIAIIPQKLHDYVQKTIIPVQECSEETVFHEIDEIWKTPDAWYEPHDDLPSSKEIVDNVLKQFTWYNAGNISDYSHEDTPYKATKNYGDIIQPDLVFYRSPWYISNHHNM